ncbi:MAG: class I SAM-dependent methyltransferase [Thermodesulfobacteriota bacterium]
MDVLQNKEELEKWYENPDPWGYEKNPEDLNRKAILLSAIPKKPYKKVLDIGCGNGFITNSLPGEKIIGIDISSRAIEYAKRTCPPHIEFFPYSIFDLPFLGWGKDFDLIVITGVLYPQYIGNSEKLIYTIIDDLLICRGILVCCHIEEWYSARFPYITLHREYYSYREYVHILEVYLK